MAVALGRDPSAVGRNTYAAREAAIMAIPLSQLAPLADNLKA